MLDISDGLGLDLDRLAKASGVGIALDVVPLADGATWDDAVGGGESYELVFTAADVDRIVAVYASEGLEPPIEIGRCTDDPAERRLGDGELPITGWEHEL